MSVDHLLSAILKNYLTGKTYTDRGRVVLSWYDLAGTETISPEEIDFATWFVRGHNFRMEFQRRHCPSIADFIQVDQYGHGRKYIGIGNAYILTEDDAPNTIDLAEGSSGGSTVLIASLLGLMQDSLLLGANTTGFIDVGTERIESRLCEHLVNANLQGRHLELWLSAKDLQILRVRLCYIPDAFLNSSVPAPFYPSATYYTYHFDRIEFNASVNSEVFQLPAEDHILSAQELDVVSVLDGLGYSKKRTMKEAAIFCELPVEEVGRIYEVASKKIGP
jgi:hypothetical protein